MGVRFGISRNHGGPQIVEGANLFVEALGAAAGVKVRLVVGFDYDHQLKTFVGGGSELAWLPPILLAQTTSAPGAGARVVAMFDRGDGLCHYRSALVVREDAPIHSAADLNGKRAAWVHKSSAGGYAFARLRLMRAGVSLAEETFVGSATKASAAVDRGDADVCAVYVRPWHTTPAAATADMRVLLGATGRRLRVVEVCDQIPPDGIAMSDKVEEPERAALLAALGRMHEFPDGVAGLSTLFQATQLLPPTPEAVAAIAAVLGKVAPLALL
jgi:ABC-type phosphate/phosphonate transport system substrate-binding protein